MKTILFCLLVLIPIPSYRYPKVAWTGLGSCTDQDGFCGQFQWFQEWTTVTDNRGVTRFFVWLVIPPDTEATREAVEPIVKQSLDGVIRTMDDSIWMYERNQTIRVPGYRLPPGKSFYTDAYEDNPFERDRYYPPVLSVKRAQLIQILTELRQYQVTDIGIVANVVLEELKRFKANE